MNKNIYKKRILIENIFSILKNKKRINIRYDTTIKSYNSFVFLSLILDYALKMLI